MYILCSVLVSCMRVVYMSVCYEQCNLRNDTDSGDFKKVKEWLANRWNEFTERQKSNKIGVPRSATECLAHDLLTRDQDRVVGTVFMWDGHPKVGSPKERVNIGAVRVLAVGCTSYQNIVIPADHVLVVSNRSAFVCVLLNVQPCVC